MLYGVLLGLVHPIFNSVTSTAHVIWCSLGPGISCFCQCPIYCSCYMVFSWAWYILFLTVSHLLLMLYGVLLGLVYPVFNSVLSTAHVIWCSLGPGISCFCQCPIYCSCTMVFSWAWYILFLTVLSTAHVIWCSLGPGTSYF